jgi:hypothetical protein
VRDSEHQCLQVFFGQRIEVLARKEIEELETQGRSQQVCGRVRR